ncbi:MAG TPA: hypothetical protein VGG89_11800 [Candidatus Baltobacteraceae bacterium]
MRVRPAVLAGVVAAVITAALSHLRATPYDNYVYLAQALLHGHAWIDLPGAWIDALRYAGRYYVIEAPLPAILLLPYVAAAGLQANQTVLSVALCGVAVGAAWQLGERFGLSQASNAWICAFLLAGTDLLWCATFGDVWFIAHVSAVAFTMLALAEIAGKRRPWLVALWAACAFESRFSLLLAVPVYFVLLGAPKQWKQTVAQFAAVLVPVALLWLWYNEARWGTWNDIGYVAWYHQDQAGMPTGSPFRLEYLPYQLWSFFVQAPKQLTDYPGLQPDISGVALTWTSPALILAFFARSPFRWTIALWILTLAAAAPNFVYYVNGFAQFGMRHALDFEPFLVALMMLAVRDRFARWGYVLVAYSCVVGLWGIWFWQTFIRT